MDQLILILTHCPDYTCAHNLARELVTHNLAACVNIGTSATSLYKWQGTLEQAQEVPLFIKTQQTYYAKVETWISKHHPYEIPEIIAIPIIDGLPAYLQWVQNNIQESISDS